MERYKLKIKDNEDLISDEAKEVMTKTSDEDKSILEKEIKRLSTLLFLTLHDVEIMQNKNSWYEKELPRIHRNYQELKDCYEALDRLNRNMTDSESPLRKAYMDAHYKKLGIVIEEVE